MNMPLQKPQKFSLDDAKQLVQIVENTPLQMTVVAARNVDQLLNRFKIHVNETLVPKPATPPAGKGKKQQEKPSEDPLGDGKSASA